MTDSDPPLPEIERPKAESRSRRVSAVWLVPLLALIIALGLAWQTYSSRGPLIEIVFDDAAGLVAGETPVRFRDVTVGMVETIELSQDLRQVVVNARIEKDSARLIDSDANFWVVRPSITPQGVSGLDTVFSGAFIGASWDDQPGEAENRFDGLSRPPLTPAGTPGLRVRIRATAGGSMTIGAPVLFKQIQVGQIEDIQLTDAGDVMIDLFVHAPHDRRLTEATRFWNASGFSVELGSGGALLNVGSLISLIQGGVSFDAIGSDPTPAEEDHVYQLYESETAARQNLIEDIPSNTLMLNVDFDQSVRGLSPGAQVQFQGIPVGEVTGIQGVAETENGQTVLRQRATISLVPERFGQPETPPEGGTREAALDYIEVRVNEGLRAQLASQGLLTQTLYVNLVELPGASPALFQRNAEPYPILPSAPSSAGDVADSAAGIMDRLSALPIEEVVQNVITLLSNANSVIEDPRVRSAPENLGALIADLRETLNSSGIQEAPEQIASILGAVREVVEQANQAQLVQNVNDAVVSARDTMASVGTAADGVPGLITEAETLSLHIRELPVEQLITSATNLADDIDALVRSDDVAALPGSVADTVAELRGTVTDLRNGGAVTNLNASLASLRQVSDELAAANIANSLQQILTDAQGVAGSVRTASNGLPDLISTIELLLQDARALPLADLVTRADGVLVSANSFLVSEDMQSVPTRLSDSLGELRGLLQQLDEGGAAANLSGTLASARQVADRLAAVQIGEAVQYIIEQARVASENVSTSTEALPELIASFQSVSDKIDSLPLDQVVASLDDTLRSAGTLLRSEGVTNLPPRVGDAVESLRLILDEARNGDTIGKVNSALESADIAAARLAEDLPALVQRFTEVADRADAVLATLRPGSQINRQVIQVLQELRAAARSANSLATTLERRPNALLFGR